MSRQDKATTEKFTKTLRELVKKPDNKVCADCKRNDPRWASWNLGVFLCIRCSGIHRGMGTHISKVKSVDLDVWTPEQMESIQKWGNRLANLYWEAHLKVGHVPPEHKMESFIRSKYESRRWALDGPPPSDPSVLDTDSGVASAPQSPVTAAKPAPAPTHTSTNSFSSRATSAARQPQTHQLLSANYANRPVGVVPQPTTAPGAPTATPAPTQPPKGPADDLFSLDFHAPSTSSSGFASQTPEQKKDVKQDILSLFSAAPANNTFGQFTSDTSAKWGGAAPQQQQQQQQQYQQPAPATQAGMMGMNGTGMWGATSGWTPPAVPAQQNVWGSSASQQQQQYHQQQAPQFNMFDTNAAWATPAPTPDPFGSFAAQPAQTQKKDDAFGDIWGTFK